jgi:polysaccharide export outer membrane protein
MAFPVSAGLRSTAAAAALAITLGGCASLPSTGPTARQVIRSAQGPKNVLGYRIVDVDATIAGDAEARDRSQPSPALSHIQGGSRNDTIGAGDILTISIYEVGVSLFSGGGQLRSVGEGFDPSARGEALANVPVDADGTIKLPYVGRIAVAGRTPAEVESMIENGLRGKSQSPQVLVGIRTNISNTVFVSGEVRRPGRVEVSVTHERLLDAIAIAGGTVSPTDDMVVRFTRGANTVEERLGLIRPSSPEDVVLAPGDRIELLRRPRTFTVFGATLRAQQIPFEISSLSLAEAIARTGGPNENAADPSAVFLFRYDAPRSPDAPEAPVIYRLNMMNPQSYFLSQRFVMHDKDVIYIANAAANQPSKFVNIINQLFSPFITARAITR